MKILAVEFSSAHRSVALVTGEGGGKGHVAAQAEEVVVRSTRALHLVEQVLADAGVARAAVECIAVGLGPGSYTGIRAAISLAQGWELALGVKVTGISSVEALAMRATEGGIRGPFTIVVDAHRSEFYVARYENEGGLRRIGELRLAARDEVEKLAAGGEVILGPGADRVVPEGRDLAPEASMVGHLAGRSRSFVASGSLEPIYLRETQFVKATPPRWTGS